MAASFLSQEIEIGHRLDAFGKDLNVEFKNIIRMAPAVAALLDQLRQAQNVVLLFDGRDVLKACGVSDPLCLVRPVLW
ncbi:hypothetical protein QO002_006276 [Pararhizobium capsulatum DSM 1112]|uniref:Uncharacterized protein n=1 Tax=Pararhizobium capsulatum DSM 1112 TaxID=1121113 RepID=A0ABU0C292_9HYPH|nr:hypothetical protein [Pararhizobium capsulatum]MDQ0324069.1 hypothetical protein [Pararhizobium capsulatum DSM 1112]